VTLDEGLELLQASKDLCMTFKVQKDENVLSETLFDLPISTYPDLNDMTEKNKLYDLIYDIYREHREAVKDFSIVAWSKLDISNLQVSAEKFVVMVKKLEKKLNQINVRPESLHPFNKLQKTIEGFKTSIPFIVELKHPAV
jgi:dynein heavy chain